MTQDDGDDGKGGAAEMDVVKIYNYIAEVSVPIQEVCNRFGIPEESIIDFEENDFVMVLKCHGTLEPLLREAVVQKFRSFIASEHVDSDGVQSISKILSDLDFDRRRKLALSLQIINSEDSDFIDAVAKIRNRYAHHIANASLSLEEISEKIAKDGPKNILEKLAPSNYKVPIATRYDPRFILFDRLAKLIGKLNEYFTTEN